MNDAKPAPGLSPFAQDHIKHYLESGGKEGHLWGSARAAYGGRSQTTLLLTVTGRKSGQRLIFPLIYGQAAGGYVVVASKGGAPQHPGWYLNLLANPKVEVQVGTSRFPAVARVLAGEERGAIWQHMVNQFPPYAEYQQNTAREIPVVMLEPAAM